MFPISLVCLHTIVQRWPETRPIALPPLSCTRPYVSAVPQPHTNVGGAPRAALRTLLLPVLFSRSSFPGPLSRSSFSTRTPRPLRTTINPASNGPRQVRRHGHVGRGPDGVPRRQGVRHHLRPTPTNTKPRHVQHWQTQKGKLKKDFADSADSPGAN